jgi:acyl-CoA synthetase (NDP forming)
VPDSVQLSPFADISRILSPRSIAVIGASDQPGNLGGVAVRMLQKFGYPGAISPVNPRRARVGDLPCYPSVSALPGPADLAIFATGAEAAPGLVRECAAAGISHGIVWAGGFAEVGAVGAALQDELVRACCETGFTAVGPNCIGVIDSRLPMAASFASFLTETDALLLGKISMVSQSGGLATMALALAQEAGFGFRSMISSGNEALLSAADYIHAMVEDPHTEVIAAYLEGVRDGDQFIAALEEARCADKPVIVLKGGGTAASARAAAAHTGALVGEARVWDAVFREQGVLQARSLEELLDLALFLSSTDLRKLPAGKGVAAISFGGGSGVLSADQCARNGLSTPPLSPATQERLKPLLPPIASCQNPIDLTPQTFNQERWFALLPEALDVIAADPAIEIVLLLFGPQAQRGLDVAQEICAFRARTDKPVCLAWPLAPRGVPEFLREQDVHVFHEYARAIAVLGKLAARSSRRGAGVRAAVPASRFDWASCVPTPTPDTVVSEDECHRILAAAGLPVAAGRLARSESEAAEAAQTVGLPVAMKGISPEVTHRAAAGLLALGIGSAGEARQTYRRLADHAAAANIPLDGVYVQHIVRGGIEILVSAFRDPLFGVMVSCGAGGNMTEIIDDVTLARGPLEEAAACEMLGRLRIVQGARKLDPEANLRTLAQFVAQFSHVAAGAPWRRFVLEVNPVKWRPDGVTAVDGLILIEEL